MTFSYGGRGPLNTVLRYTLATQSFEIEAQTMPYALEDVSAWVPPGGTKVFVVGSTGGGLGRHLISRPANGQGAWSTRAGAPDDLAHALGMGTYGERIFPTRWGLFIDEAVENAFGDLVTPAYTAQMEARLDDIAEGTRPWTEIIRSWHERFSLYLDGVGAFFEQMAIARPAVVTQASPSNS